MTGEGKGGRAGAAGPRSSRGGNGSFETLLREVFADLAAGDAFDDAVTAACDRVARFFGADRAAIVLADGQPKETAGPRPGPAAAFEVELRTPGRANGDRALLHSDDRERQWSALEAARLQLVGKVIACGMLLHRLESAALGAAEGVTPAFDALPGLVAVLDADLRVVRVDRALSERLGRDVDGCAGESWVRLLGGRDEDTRAALEAALARVRDRGAELELPSLGGTFLVTISPISTTGGEASGSYLTLRDVTAQRRAESELQDSREWLLTALESAKIGVWDWDVATDKVRYISPFSAPAGNTLELHETTGDNWFHTTHPEDIQAARAQIDGAIAGEADEYAFTVRTAGPGGGGAQWRQIYSRGRVVSRDRRGRATRLVGAYEDVTKAMRDQDVEREREATLAHATKLAALGALASSLAHEINQPLAALTSFLDASTRLLAKGESHRDEVADALQRSAAQAEKASEIVRRLRRLLRRERPLLEAIELPDLFHATCDQLRREARAAGVELEVAAASEPVSFRGDRVQIEQVLVNLVRNAIEALAGGDGRAKVVTLSARRSGSFVELRVADNGPGVAEADADRLFEPFFTTKSGGSGLGLVICESIAEIHGGRIRFEPRPGGPGACFVLELPERQEGGGDEPVSVGG
jgi:signal transduction histidine kinase